MNQYTVIQASEDQIYKLVHKHLVTRYPSLFGPGNEKTRVKSYNFSYDSEDQIGFVTLKTDTGKTVEYQLRRGIPCFVEFTGFGAIRYDISYPKDKLLEILTHWGKVAHDNFWAGGEI